MGPCRRRASLSRSRGCVRSPPPASGTVAGSAEAGFTFLPGDSSEAAPLRAGDTLIFPKPEATAPSPSAPFQLLGGECFRISGTLRSLDPAGIEGWESFPAPLQDALRTMDRVVASASAIDVGDTRANVVEPQLAYVLQRLEHTLQKGRGCGHGLLAVLRVGPKD